MSIQTSVALAPAVSLPGSADAGPMRKSSRAAEGVVGFGLVVSRGTDKNEQCLVGGADGTAPLGISLRDLSQLSDATSITYKDESAVSIAENGALYVLVVTDAVTAGDTVTYIASTGVIDGGAEDVSGGVLELDGWVFDQSVAAGAMVLVKKL